MSKKSQNQRGVVFNKDLPRHKCKKYLKSAIYVVAYLVMLCAVAGVFMYALLTPDH